MSNLPGLASRVSQTCSGIDSEAARDLTVMTEAELASMRTEEGNSVVFRNGRYWRAIFPGFYQPIHLLARLHVAEFKRPIGLCWGYRAALDEEAAHLANGSVPVYLWADVQQFTESLLNRNRKADLRKCRREVEIGRLRDPSIVIEQGYSVFMSAMRRVAYWRPRSEAYYQETMGRKALDERRLIVVGLIDGRLGGYMESYAVDGVLYADELIVSTEAMRTGIGTGLYVETIKIGARSPSVKDVCVGLETPERPGLSAMKKGLGFRVAHVPARVVIPGPIAASIRVLRPAAYYRLTGVRPALTANAEE